MTYWVGVMSGTSLDGIDVAIVELTGDAELFESWEVLTFHTEQYTPQQRAMIRAVINSGSAAAICDLDFELGTQFAKAVLSALKLAPIPADAIEAVGSHGQTIWHRPPGEDRSGATLQLGQPAVIAEQTGLPVVSNFRARDMAVGGEGAPLTAYTDELLFRGSEALAIQNIGGISNVTALPVHGTDKQAIAFDPGPGVALIDAAVERLTDGAQTYDWNGELASRGTVSEDALNEWLGDPYFQLAPPKSTGRERFSECRLWEWLLIHADLSVEDLIATLTELTVRTIADSYRFIEFDLASCYLCGGGARNPSLVRRLREHLDPLPVRNLAELSLDPDAREAVAFAILARQHILGIPSSASWATGARTSCVLGDLTPA